MQPVRAFDARGSACAARRGRGAEDHVAPSWRSSSRDRSPGGGARGGGGGWGGGGVVGVGGCFVGPWGVGGGGVGVGVWGVVGCVCLFGFLCVWGFRSPPRIEIAVGSSPTRLAAVSRRRSRAIATRSARRPRAGRAVLHPLPEPPLERGAGAIARNLRGFAVTIIAGHFFTRPEHRVGAEFGSEQITPLNAARLLGAAALGRVGKVRPSMTRSRRRCRRALTGS